MGTWFPDWHRAAPGQLAAHDQAVRALRAEDERHEETPAYERLNQRVNVLREPLSPWQRTNAATDWRIMRMERAEERDQIARDTGRQGAFARGARQAMDRDWARRGSR